MSESKKSPCDQKPVQGTTHTVPDIPQVPNNDNEQESKYVVLMETSGEECESWYYCIKYEGNEKNLKHLQEQLETVDWYILDDLSTFDLDLDHFITIKTAKQLTKLELNHHSFHRKFDGVLDKIDLNLRTKDKNEKKMVKIFDILGYGQIEDYIDGEDLDEEDLTDTPQTSSDDDDPEGSSSDSSVESHDREKSKTNKKGIPVALQKSNLPRFAKAKRRQRKKD
jgi:hypothetical protein